MSGHTPTAEQTAVIEAFEFGADLVVEAGAGTGKTSTLKLLAAAAPRERGVYIAYNRSIAADAQRSFPGTVTCKTAHGLAYASVGRQYRHRLDGPRIPAQRTAEILGIRDRVQIGDAYLAPQSLARLTMETVTRWCYSGDDRIGRMSVPLVTGLDKLGQRQLAQYLAPIAQRAWDEDLSQVDGQLRFTHDYYLKLWILSKPQLPCDYVLLDEAQDSNGAVAGLVTAQNAQRIWVGDRSQAIYGWRGATDAMEHAPGQRLMLSQSFRFGETIADEANKWLSLLDAPLRLRGYDQIPSRVEPVAAPDAILCRTNAGAIGAVVSATGAGRRVALVGGGQDIRRMAEAARDLRSGRGTDHPELMAFSSWADVVAYVEDSGSEASDLRVFVKLIETHGSEGVIRIVDHLCDERVADLVVSTAHKAKGREWSAVRLADDFSEPRPDQHGHVRLAADECMLAYVSVTRAQRVLDRGALAWIDRYAGPAATALPAPVDPVPAPVAVAAELVDEQPAAPKPDPVLSWTADPCPACGYLLDQAGACTTCVAEDLTPAPAAAPPAAPDGPYPVGTRVRYRHTTGTTVYTVVEARPSLAIGWVYAIQEPRGGIQRGVAGEHLMLDDPWADRHPAGPATAPPPAAEPDPLTGPGYVVGDGNHDAAGRLLSPDCYRCREPYQDCTCPVMADRRPLEAAARA